MPSALAKRLIQALYAMEAPPTQAEIARIAGVKASSVNDWFSGKTKRLGKALVPVSRMLNVMPEWLNEGKLPMRQPPGPEGSLGVHEPQPGYGSAFEIVFVDAPASCGNGRGVMEEVPTSIVMGAAWFKDRGLNADDLFAVRADGDGNADYITHGDIVIFNATKKTPETGRLFMIHHPDGLRIRRLRRDIGNGWLLEYLNSDKQRFPDERVSADQLELLRIEGQFVFRQGG